MPKRAALGRTGGRPREVVPEPPVAVVHRDRLSEAPPRLRKKARGELHLPLCLPGSRRPRHQRARPPRIGRCLAEPSLVTRRCAAAERGVPEQRDCRERPDDDREGREGKPRRRCKRPRRAPASGDEQDRHAAEQTDERDSRQFPVPVDSCMNQVRDVRAHGRRSEGVLSGMSESQQRYDEQPDQE